MNPFMKVFLDRDTRQVPTDEPFNHPLFASANAVWASDQSGQWAGSVDNEDGSSIMRWLMPRDAAMTRQALEAAMNGEDTPLAQVDFATAAYWVLSDKIEPNARDFLTDCNWHASTPITGDKDLLEAIGAQVFGDTLEQGRRRGLAIHPDTQALLVPKRSAAPTMR